MNPTEHDRQDNAHSHQHRLHDIRPYHCFDPTLEEPRDCIGFSLEQRAYDAGVQRADRSACHDRQPGVQASHLTEG